MGTGCLMREEGESVKVLVAEDDVVSRRILEKLLVQWGYEPVSACNGGEAWVILQEPDAPQLALLDWIMPEMDGMELCRRIRHRESGPYVYMILVTARNQREEMLQALDDGVDDYLVKPWDVAELRGRLNAGTRIVRLQEELIHAQDALRFQASHDSLTGLSNRQEILDTLQRELGRARRQHTMVGVVLADLDRFKRVNDTCGHLIGDAVLEEAARRILGSVRSYDAVGRYGGEEFLVVVPSADGLGVLAHAKRINAAFDGRPFAAQGASLNLTLSLGVALADDSVSLNARDLLRAADAALYRGKRKGRNRIEFATAAELEGVFSTPILLANA